MVRARAKSTATDVAQAARLSRMSDMTPDILASERETLIQDKQKELGKILARHDGLIREQFQLENYGLMLFYNPEVAKDDHTNEFQRFKDSHDLMRFMPTSGPSRTTRRAQTDRISALAQLSEPSSVVSTPLSPGASLKRGDQAPSRVASMKGKQKKAVRPVTMNGTESHISAKAQGKRKAVDVAPGAEASLDGEGGLESITVCHTGFRPRGRLKAGSSLSEVSSRKSRSLSTSTDLASASTAMVSGRPTRSSLRSEGSDVSQPSKKRKVSMNDVKSHRQLRVAGQSSSAKLSSPAETRPTTSGKSLPGKALPTNSTPLPRPTIKRIKLIVRPPPRNLSSPRQRPNPPLFNYSLPALLNSYVEIDGKSYSSSELEAAARRDARILNRIDELRKRGRFPVRGFGGLNGTSTPTHQPSDIWSIVVKDVIAARNTISRHRFGHGGALASVVHTRLHAHWDLLRKDLEREQVQEERRLRALAKSILRFVIAEWKKAVFHVREQMRVALEAEEARRGRLHLDEILDQSGQILERQQLELVRSGSVSVDNDEEFDEEDENEDEETELEGSEADGDESRDSEVVTEMEDEMDEAISVQDGESYIDYSAPLNDVEDSMDNVLSNIELLASEEGDIPLSKTSLEGRIVPVKVNGISKTVVEHDASPPRLQAIHPLLDEDNSSSKASLESNSLADIQAHKDELLSMGFEIGPETQDIPMLEMSNGLEQDSVILHNESLAEEKPIQISKPSELPSTEPVVDAVEDDSPMQISPVDMEDVDTRPKLTNGHVNHVHVGDTSADVQTATGDTEDLTQGMNGSTVDGAKPTPQSANIKYAVEPGDDAQKEELATESEEDAKSVGGDAASELESEWEPPPELQSYAVTHVNWEPGSKIVPPLLLRGNLRPYQQSGLEWLASLYNNETNGILADEMGLGKTIQTIALLAHLACDRGIWGPHLIIVPTSVLLNWEMEFKKFLPGFKILSYHGTTKRRKELRQGWNNKYRFNVCITSYTLASRDQHIFKRKAWYYMVLDEAHMIKNFKSQRWNILLMFRSFRRLLLTGTPLQNNLTELWALLRFLMSGTNFANQKEFSEWFGIPLEKAIEVGNLQDQEVQLQVMKLHEMLRPFLLRRMKKDVEKELPKKYDHLVLCRLSKRQRFLYDEFMSRAQTREDLKSGVYQKIANILMQLRKVCNHPDLFEVRPIVTSFAMEKSAIAEFEIRELLIRRRLLEDDDRSSHINLDVLGLQFTRLCNTSLIASHATRLLEESLAAELGAAEPGESPPRDLRTIEGFRKYDAYQRRLSTFLRYQHMSYLNKLRCNRHVAFGLETINTVKHFYNPLTTECETEFMSECRPANHMIKSYLQRAEEMEDVIEKFAFATPAVVARDISALVLREVPEGAIKSLPMDFDAVLHKPTVKLQIAFPDLSLLQYDCGKLQELDWLLRERKAGGHRVLIFTQMTRILDILELFLNYHGYLYLRLDGATKIEDRQYITERFNADPRIFVFIASSRSGGVGINLTGADTVIFYDSDFNPQMDKQCEDRAHRIGQIRDVHIYRFISQYTVEEAMLRKANQKRSLDDIVIQQGDFDWKNFFRADADANGDTSSSNVNMNATALQTALVEFEDFEDAEAAKFAAREAALVEGEDRAEFGEAVDTPKTPTARFGSEECATAVPVEDREISTTGDVDAQQQGGMDDAEEDEEEGGTTIDYMIKFVRSDLEFFREWKLP
ncbi:uncharacterized protein FOMMEDRAFT_16586 [Fomitiporia mediterranea MF3/22]|uniref:uncharacterized protein n=1 Tax=Fomitiporia mediterranea (strain MF3/22) TaxID=694068 RepID=UPI0004409B5D|nr:uncharacterized protein FOMMEDRAFT_16586 [Fomitiporia mediterranea MF3/22]EJD08094.1 hypothetical protein FOMMEDRAFT_16586 [Fomitiporia mediterranea MF3/22]